MNQAVRKLIALLAALALVCSLAACSSQQSEEENTTEPPIVSKTKKPEANAEVLAYFNRLVNSAKQSNPEFTMTKEPKVSEVETSNQTLANLAPTLQQLMLNLLKRYKALRGAACFRPGVGEPINPFRHPLRDVCAGR